MACHHFSQQSDVPMVNCSISEPKYFVQALKDAASLGPRRMLEVHAANVSMLRVLAAG
jgi:hypothetical protein